MSNVSHLEFNFACAGHLAAIPRTLEVARRVEAAIGAIDPFASRLDKGQVTTTELVRVYTALLRSDPAAPALDKIEAWVFEQGLYARVHRDVAWFLVTLIMGSDAFAREMARSKAPPGSAAPTEPARGPFEKAA